MPIRVICLGKTKEPWIKKGIDEYLKRLIPVWKIQWDELKDVSLKLATSHETVRQREAATILKAVPDNAFIIALDERGKRFNSQAFAGFLKDMVGSGEIVFIIGGVYGLDSSLRKRANLCLSFSDFTFPHQLIRLLLIEQLYRSWTIIAGKTYHY